MKFYCFSLIVAAIAPLAVVANRNIRGSNLDDTNGEINEFLDYFRILGVGSIIDKGDVQGDDDGAEVKAPAEDKDTKSEKSMKSKKEKSEKKSKEKSLKKEKSEKKEKVRYFYYCLDLFMHLFLLKYHMNI
jgi:hypothetical protein